MNFNIFCIRETEEHDIFILLKGKIIVVLCDFINMEGLKDLLEVEKK